MTYESTKTGAQVDALLDGAVQKAFTKSASSESHLVITPAHPSNPPWTIVSNESNNFDGNKNFVVSLGHNISISGDRIDPAKGQILLHMESNWEPSASTSLQECHLTFGPPAGGSVRVWSFNYQSNPSDPDGIGYKHFISADRFELHTPSASIPFIRWGQTSTTCGQQFFTPTGGTQFEIMLNATQTSINAGSKPIIIDSSSTTINGVAIVPGTSVSWGGAKLGATTFNALTTFENTNIFFTGSVAGKVFLEAEGGNINILELLRPSNDVRIRNNLSTGSVIFGTSHGSGAGSAVLQTRDLNRVEVRPTGETRFMPDGAAIAMEVRAAEVLFNVPGRTPPVAVSALPPATAALAGTRAAVNDCNTTTFWAVVAGGGGNTVPVFCTGSDWRVGG